MRAKNLKEIGIDLIAIQDKYGPNIDIEILNYLNGDGNEYEYIRNINNLGKRRIDNRTLEQIMECENIEFISLSKDVIHIECTAPRGLIIDFDTETYKDEGFNDTPSINSMLYSEEFLTHVKNGEQLLFTVFADTDENEFTIKTNIEEAPNLVYGFVTRFMQFDITMAFIYPRFGRYEFATKISDTTYISTAEEMIFRANIKPIANIKPKEI
jgi:hypothetical protein